jgi:hypothetical protein
VEDYTVNIGTSMPGEVGTASVAAVGLQFNGPEQGAGFSLFPNPAQGQVFLDYRAGEAGDVQLELMDLMGRTLQLTTTYAAVGENRFELNTANLPEGAYMLRLRQNDQQFVKRVVISR